MKTHYSILPGKFYGLRNLAGTFHGVTKSRTKLSTHVYIQDLLGQSQFFLIMNKAPMHIPVSLFCGYMLSFLLGEQLVVKLLAHK